MVMMRKLKFISFMNNMVHDLPSPSNISYAWNFGSALGVALGIQIVSGVMLTMHYSPNIFIAFDSVSFISREINYGWLLKNSHANGASMFFLCIYFHMGRGLYYMNYAKKHVWILGVLIYILSMATAFMGYLLPWGQMSFWGATVITNMFSAIPYIGESLVSWLWGGFAVNNATLNRFFSFHFIFPFVILVFVIFHLMALHQTGSSNPLGVDSNFLKTSFSSHFSIKDVKGFFVFFFILLLIVFFSPNFLGDSENFINANPLSTPIHIKPEWYFLWAYTILRSIPSKLGGVMLMGFSIVLLFFLPIMWNKYNNSTFFWFHNNSMVWELYSLFLILTWAGAQPVEHPYNLVGLITTFFYLNWIFLMIF